MFRRFLDPYSFGGFLFAPDPPPAGDPPKNDPPPAGDPPKNDPPADKTFTQAELDRIVQDRVARERQKFGDYDDLKAKAAKADEYEAANASEVEKAQKAAQEASDKLAKRTENARRANLVASLAARDDVGPARARAAAKLIEGVDYDDDTDEPKNLDERVTSLLAEHEFLKASGQPAGDADGGKGKSGGMTAEDVRKLAKDNPAEFTRKLEAGEIPTSALGAST